MKAAFPRRLAAILLALALLGSGVGCTTTYDHAGRPVQRLDGEKAVVGLLLAGVAAYVIANADDRDRCDRHHDWYDDDCGYCR